MPRKSIKDAHIIVYMTNSRKMELEKIAQLNNKTLSEFALEMLNTAVDSGKQDAPLNDLTVLLKKHFKDVKSFERQQQITMYIMMQFSMYIASSAHDKDGIMDFYEDAYKGAIEKFGKEDG